MIFVAGGKAVDRKVEKANQKVLRQIEAEHAKALSAQNRKREEKFANLNPVQKFAVKILNTLKNSLNF